MNFWRYCKSLGFHKVKALNAKTFSYLSINSSQVINMDEIGENMKP